MIAFFFFSYKTIRLLHTWSILYPLISDIVKEMKRTVFESEIYIKTPIKLQVNKITSQNSLSVSNENSLMVIFGAYLL